MLRGVLGGLIGFALAGVLLAAILGRVLPDDWTTGAFAVTGIAAAATAGAAGGLAGRGGPPPAAVLGALLGALLLVALQPQADLVTLASLIAVAAGAAGTSLPRHTSNQGHNARIRA